MLPAGSQDCFYADLAGTYVGAAANQPDVLMSEIHQMFNRSAHACGMIRYDGGHIQPPNFAIQQHKWTIQRLELGNAVRIVFIGKRQDEAIHPALA